MPPRIPIETSARHIHITKEDFEALFGTGKELTFVKELSQPGQYLAAEKLAVIGPRGQFEKVSILGPFRKETQVEISVTDARKLGIPSVIRQSGDIPDTPRLYSAGGGKRNYIGTRCHRGEAAYPYASGGCVPVQCKGQ